MRALSLAGLLTTLVAVSAIAQDPPKVPGPQKEHEWLQQLVGDWESEMEVSPGPGAEKSICKGTAQTKSLGGLWVVTEVKSEMFGTPFTAVQTIGYDPKSSKYVGTWVDSMMNHMWKYEGSIDSTGKILTLEAEGPHMTEEGKTTMYRDIYEIKSKDHVVMTSSVKGDDGKWVTFMTGNSRRKGSKSI